MGLTHNGLVWSPILPAFVDQPSITNLLDIQWQCQSNCRNTYLSAWITVSVMSAAAHHTDGKLCALCCVCGAVMCAVWCWNVPHYSVCYCAVLCCAELSCAVLCCAVPCCALCPAMLCPRPAMLWRAVLCIAELHLAGLRRCQICCAGNNSKAVMSSKHCFQCQSSKLHVCQESAGP